MVLICPERPGYGLSTFTKGYTIENHAQDVRYLINHLGHRRYKVQATSGGDPYGLSLTHLASKEEVVGTVLVAPVTPSEGTRTGLSLNRYLRDLEIMLFSWFVVWRTNNAGYTRFKLSTLDAREIGKKKRKTREGKDELLSREKKSYPKSYVEDFRHNMRSWGFKLQDIDAKKIAIFAGGLDTNTPSAGVRYMRNRLRNCELHEYPGDDHYTLQEEHGLRILDYLRTM
jgi:pimeloyl-ACP methyl ester carboxylesterase